jgi:hypothetical protein
MGGYITRFAKTLREILSVRITCRIGFGAWIVAMGLLATGCGTVNRMVASSMGGMLGSLREQPDPQLVRDGAPAYLLAIDGLITNDPENPDLLRDGCTAYATYASAFLSGEADAERAGRLQGRAREYGQRLLRLHAGYARAEAAPMPEFEAALAQLGRADVPDLYAAGNAWLGWIIAKNESMAAMAELPRALAVMQRSLALDEGYAEGGAHLVFAVYYTLQPPGAGQDLAKSRQHFERAMALGGPQSLMPKVLFAEFYARAAVDPDLFTRTLRAVLEAPETAPPPLRLMNAIARERATRLLQQKDELF